MPPHPIPRASNRYEGPTTLLGQYQTHHHRQMTCLEPQREMCVCWQPNIVHPNCCAFPWTFLGCGPRSEMLVPCEVDSGLCRVVPAEARRVWCCAGSHIHVYMYYCVLSV